MSGRDPSSEDGEEVAATELVDTAAEERSELVDADELPVVARMVVEIRSDGSRTVTRGVLEDHVQGEKVAVEAAAPTLPGLATGLARALMRMPGLERRAARAALDAPRGRRGVLGRLRGRLLGDDDSR